MTTKTTPIEILKARKAINNLRSFVRRAGLTGWVRERNARTQYQAAFEAVVRVEDAHGIDAAYALGQRLDDLRREAVSAGLITAGDVLDAESAVIARIDNPNAA